MDAKDQARFDAARRVAEHICGTCTGYDGAVEEEPLIAEMEELAARILIERAGEIFLCDGCGWWCENEEMVSAGSDQLCADCDSEREDDPNDPDDDMV